MAITYDSVMADIDAAASGATSAAGANAPWSPEGSGVNLGGLLSGALDLALYNKLIENNKDTANTTLNDLDAAIAAASDAAAFTPYAVTSNLGKSNVGVNAAGKTNITHSMDPTLEGYADTLRSEGMGLMSQSAMDPTQREQGVTDEILAAMAGQRERDKMGLDSSLWNTGRGGVASGAYGGSPEQLAFFKALDEGNLNAAIAGKDFNLREQDALYKRGSGMFNTSFVPNEVMQKDFGLGTNTSQLANQAGQSQGDLLAQMGLGRAGTALNFSNLDTKATMDLYNALSLAAGGSGIGGSGGGSGGGGLIDMFLNSKYNPFK